MQKTNKQSVSLILVFFTLISFVLQAQNKNFVFAHEPYRVNASSPSLDSSRTKESASEQKQNQQTENPPVIEYFTATPSSVYIGMDVLLIWSVKNATMVGITPGIGIVGHTSSVSVRPIVTTTYTLTVLNNSKMVKQEVTIKVSPPPPPPPPPPTSGSTGAHSSGHSSSGICME